MKKSNEIRDQFLAEPSESLISFLKNGIAFNGNPEIESSDNLANLLGNGSDFNLHRLLSDFSVFDGNLENIDEIKNDFNKMFDFQSVDEIDAFASDDNQSNTPLDNLHQITTDDLTDPFNDEVIDSVAQVLQTVQTQFKVEYEQPEMNVEQMNSEQLLNLTPDLNESCVDHFTFDSAAIRNYEHDYIATTNPLCSFVDTPTPSPSMSATRRTSRRMPVRTSSRLQSRAKLISFDQIIDENFNSPAFSETSSTSSRLTRHRSYPTKTDEQNGDDRSSYLERRRKNNEASKLSRAARKQRFDEMEAQCIVYEKHNGELRGKIETLEAVTAALRKGLVNNFQRRLPMGNS